MNLQTDRQLVPANGTVVRHMLIQVTAPGRSRQTARPPVSVALVLDRSGSMGGPKIELARKAVDHAIRLLGPQDHLAIVAFDTEFDTVLGSTLATAEAKTLAKNRLNSIDARGGTDLHGGWSVAASELLNYSNADELKRVLLLTDGQANQGETNPDTLASYASSLRASGVQTSTFGLGRDFDEVLLARLSREGGGNFYYIEAPEQIPDFFASELGETLEVVARDARVIVTGSRGVRATCLHDFPTRPEHEGMGIGIRLGDLVAEQQITILVALQFDDLGLEDQAELRGQAELRWIDVQLTDRDNVLFNAPMRVQFQVVDDETNRRQPASVPVILEVANLIASRANAAALTANRAGDYDRARAIVTEAASAIRALVDGRLEAQPALREVMRIADELEGQGDVLGDSMDLQVMKSRHYQSVNAMRSRSATGSARRRA
jgi:Ca-activated chloride channel homolog